MDFENAVAPLGATGAEIFPWAYPDDAVKSLMAIRGTQRIALIGAPVRAIDDELVLIGTVFEDFGRLPLAGRNLVERVFSLVPAVKRASDMDGGSRGFGGNPKEHSTFSPDIIGGNNFNGSRGRGREKSQGQKKKG
jgi:hypothetical protein